MRVEIINFGRVSSAKVQLDGITVISGPNGSGKSTISRVLMTWISYLKQIDNRITEERANSIRDAINKILSAANLPMFYMYKLPFRSLRKFLDIHFWRNRKEVIELIVKYMRGTGILFDDNKDEWNLYEEVDKLYDQIYDAVAKVQNTPDELYEFFLANSFFFRSFDNQVGSFFNRTSESSVSFELDDGITKDVTFELGKCSSLGNVRGNNVIPTFYIEPRHLIDSYADENFPKGRYSRLGEARFSCGEEMGWMRILYTNPEREMDLWSMERMNQQENLNKELDQIVTIIHGQIEKEDRVIRYKDSDAGEMISIRNIASGAKTIAALIRGLRNGVIVPGSLLIIDEPEANLHPDWQVRFAEFLSLLNAKFGIRSLLNTHSPYFLKAIRVYSDLLGIDKKCFYYMMREDQSGYQYHTDDVSDDLESVFEVMSRPYARLIYGERYDNNMEKS